MANETIGCAIFGAGWVADEHINAYIADPRSEVVAVGSRRESSALAAAARAGLGDVAIYTDLDELLADENVQALSITGPNHVHVEHGVKCCAAGKHFIMEKPIAIDLAGLHELAAAVRESGVRTVVSFCLRWNPSLINTASLVREGAIGNIFYAEGDYWHGVSDWYTGWEWARTKASGGSSFLFGGCHAVDALRWLVGSDIVQVSGAYGGGWDERYEYPATVVGTVKFASGAVGKVSSSVDCILPYQFNIDLMGDKGSIRDNRVYSTTLFPEQDGWAEVPAVLPDSGDVEHHPFEGEISHFLDCIESGEDSYVDIEDAVNTHEVCLAMDMSAERGGATIDLPLEA
ncbi:MAG: Gfo/Idh/MocA family protein [Armatimonadota bacterium]